MTRSSGSRPVWPVIAAIAVPPIAVAAVIFVALATANDTADRGEDLWVGVGNPGPTSSAPSAEVEAIHADLHDIGERCRGFSPDAIAIRSDIDRILAFAARYPIGRFPIDDETATASSLLVVTREAVRKCAPGEVARIEVAIDAAAE